MLEYGAQAGLFGAARKRLPPTRAHALNQHNPQERPSTPPNAQGGDAAQRWQQVQELLLGDHKRGVHQSFADVSQRLDKDGRRWLALIEALQKSHIEVTNALGREVQARKKLEDEVQALRRSHVSKKQFAGRLRSIADDLLPGGN